MGLREWFCSAKSWNKASWITSAVVNVPLRTSKGSWGQLGWLWSPHAGHLWPDSRSRKQTWLCACQQPERKGGRKARNQCWQAWAATWDVKRRDVFLGIGQEDAQPIFLLSPIGSLGEGSQTCGKYLPRLFGCICC